MDNLPRESVQLPKKFLEELQWSSWNNSGGFPKRTLVDLPEELRRDAGNFLDSWRNLAGLDGRIPVENTRISSWRESLDEIAGGIFGNDPRRNSETTAFFPNFSFSIQIVSITELTDRSETNQNNIALGKGPHNEIGLCQPINYLKR